MIQAGSNESKVVWLNPKSCLNESDVVERNDEFIWPSKLYGSEIEICFQRKYTFPWW